MMTKRGELGKKAWTSVSTMASSATGEELGKTVERTNANNSWLICWRENRSSMIMNGKRYGKGMGRGMDRL